MHLAIEKIYAIGFQELVLNIVLAIVGSKCQYVHSEYSCAIELLVHDIDLGHLHNSLFKTPAISSPFQFALYDHRPGL